ncbi:MAG: GIY-YIG nuclease family protein [Patescibacteria group bacterium]
MFFVYAIYNRQAKKLYIGQTENLESRIEMHNKHVFAGYTARFSGEWELIYQEIVVSRAEALKREKQLKSFRGREFVKKYIPG